MNSEILIKSLMKANDSFISSFKEILKEHGLSVKEFSKISKIPLNTLYKIISNEKKDFRVSTLRNIYDTLKKLEGTDKKFIAMIVPRVTLDKIKTRTIKINNEIIRLKEYPTLSIEEIIIAAIRAEKEGAIGIICGPMAANVIRNAVNIPISSAILDGSSINESLDSLRSKLTF